MIDILNEETIKNIHKYIKDNKDRIEVNDKLFEIYEGRIGPLLSEKMISDLNEKSYEQAKERKVPINVLKRICDKLSKIYQQEPRREVVDGKESDKKIVEKFEHLLDIDHKFNINNELWNTYYNSLLQMSISDGKPFIRTIPNNKFLVMNMSSIDPTSPDIVILFMAPELDSMLNKTDIYWIYTDTQFAIIDSTPKLRTDLMVNLKQDGSNPVPKKPFMYLNASENLPMPAIQSDTLDMTLEIPLLLSDTTYIAKFTTFSIMYGIDVDDENMKVAPNVFWKFKSDQESDKTPSIGTIKPEGDIDKLLNLATTIFELWLNLRGIKSGSIGTLQVTSAASGISKMIDEADVSEIRTFQATIYSRYEEEFWDLLLNVYYPFWKEQGLIEDYGTFTVGAKVSVNFAPQTPLHNRGEQVTSLKEEVDAGFSTVRRAIEALNPQMTETEIDELLADIEGEKEVNVEVIPNGAQPIGNEVNPKGAGLSPLGSEGPTGPAGNGFHQGENDRR